MSKKRTREEEKEENDTVIVSKRCVNLVSTEAFRVRIRRVVVILGAIFGMNLAACLADSVTLVVPDVPVSPSSSVIVMSEPVVSHWRFVELLPFFFFQKALDRLGGESRRDELRRDASKSSQ